jgi:hypothetical protein
MTAPKPLDLEALAREAAQSIIDAGLIAAVFSPLFAASEARAQKAERERAEAERHLGNLLAIIHGDGGHYQGEHGSAKATEDAIARVYEIRAERDAAQQRVSVQRKALLKTDAFLRTHWVTSAIDVATFRALADAVAFALAENAAAPPSAAQVEPER